jgi:hypothetical protein
MKDKYLQDENVLFIARNFFSYDKAIFDELVVRGAKVDLVYDVPFTRPLLKALLRKMRFFLAPLASRMIQREIAEFQTKCYAYVFVILGEGLTDGFYRRLKLLHPKAKMILYVWDGIENNRQYLKRQFKYFDLVSSFDPVDSEKYSLNFKPLFYVPPGNLVDQSNCNENRYLASFIGTSHSSRSKVLAKIRAQFSTQGNVVFIFEYLQAKWLYYLYNLWDRRYSSTAIDLISFKSMNYDSVLEVMMASKAIIDLPHPDQSGLTIRSIEALGLKKKLITTNVNIVKYDFYHPSNIMLITPNKPIVSKEFLHLDYFTLDPHIYDKYSVSEWLRSFFRENFSD